MGSTKGQAKHSRQERLKQLAEQEKNGEILDFEDNVALSDETTPIEDDPTDGDAVGTDDTASPAASDDETMAVTAVLNPVEVPTALEAEDALAGFDVDAAGFPLNMEPVADGAYLSSDFSEIPQQRKRQSLKIFGITMGILLLLLLIAYIVGAVVFMSRFLPNTVINGQDVSMKTDEEVVKMLDDAVAGYKLNVSGNGFAYDATSADIGMTIDSKTIVSAMHNDLDPWRWPLLIIESNHDETKQLVFSYDRDAFAKALAQKVKKFNKDAKAPANATIAFNDKSGKYEVKPEEEGTQLDSKAVQSAVLAGIDGLQQLVPLTADQLKKPTVYSTDKKLIESAELATGMVSAHIELNLNGQNIGIVDGEELSKYVNVSDKLDVTFKQEEFDAWVNSLTLGFDTIGTERHYTRADGKQITVKGGVYGWEIDSAATKDAVIEAVKAGKKTEIDVPCVATAAVYYGPGERDWGNRYLDVDISEQHVYYYGDNGEIIWESDCITGAPDGKRNTWEGVWYVNNKESPSTLIGYTESGKKEYETKVTYWMPFEGNGIGFHDASWQPDFGGTMYEDGYGSHGCVNLPTSAAQSLYSIIQIGDPVVVHS